MVTTLAPAFRFQSCLSSPFDFLQFWTMVRKCEPDKDSPAKTKKERVKVIKKEIEKRKLRQSLLAKREVNKQLMEETSSPHAYDTIVDTLSDDHEVSKT